MKTHFGVAAVIMLGGLLMTGVNANSFSDTAAAPSGLIRVALVDQSQAAAGLKEALANGVVDAVHSTGRPGGYFLNAAIKILLPSQLRPLETGLRAVGYGPQIDSFVLSMNRAAEAAAPKAQPIFQRALENMTFSDAQRIVSGGGHSATDYFREKTSGELRVAFTPIVSTTMDQYSVTRQYNNLLGHAGGPMSGLMGGGLTQNFDLNGYVVGKALDGLFYVIGQEEQKIRTNPAAQVTPLLRQVFGGLQ